MSCEECNDNNLIILAQIKGAAYYENASAGILNVWDVYDIVVPATEENAFFVTTGYWITTQQQGN
jgi:hypothetical protein